ncbi:5-formyltetrahydrofolate cyclo-ligase [Oceanobacillus rekensis]|uniref:5-formyltetrahydrofolate cyclo-ligase n=1 Tax=Oceanobacillus rekensis TaxID=937927 RepID=UPI000B445F22|nr:5-formyltetrahydrofolate cyclo-ligase [Oceanobacillus rekensis]
MIEKAKLRKSAIENLKNLPEVDRKRIEEKLRAQLLSSSLWSGAETIGITMAQEFEWSTKPIIQAAWEQNKKICVPKCYPKEKKLTFFELKSFDQLEVVYYNLLEPKPEMDKEINKNSMDLLIVPGVVFDRNGYRIGFGGGYYDRFLKGYPNISISLCSKLQLENHVPAEDFDIAVNYLITEDEMITI